MRTAVASIDGMVRAGQLRPTPQFVVEHGGRFIARVDLASPDQRVH